MASIAPTILGYNLLGPRFSGIYLPGPGDLLGVNQDSGLLEFSSTPGYQPLLPAVRLVDAGNPAGVLSTGS